MQEPHHDEILSPDFSNPLEYFSRNNFDNQSTPPLDTDDPWKAPTYDDRRPPEHPYTDSSTSSHGTTLDNESQQDGIHNVLRADKSRHYDPLHRSQLTASNVLSGVEVPEQYTTLFDAFSTTQRRLIDTSILESILGHANLRNDIQQEIMNLVVTPDKSHHFVTQSEFNTYQALVGCAQKNMDVSLETVYQNRHDLPIPVLATDIDGTPFDRMRYDHKEQHPFKTSFAYDKKSQSETVSRSTTSQATTDWTENDVACVEAEEQQQDVRRMEYHQEQAAMNTWLRHRDHITLSRTPAKEGFLLKHVNYEVESAKLGTKVLRRYSDYWWLWETLLKRYPFRTIPNVPPKRVGGRNNAFEEERRKGLERFINAVTSHPVLGRDEIVKAFLTHPSEMSHWRKYNSPSLDEEFVRIPHGIARYERLIPVDIVDRINQAKKRLPVSVQQYAQLCSTMEHIIKSKKALGSGFTLFSHSFNSLRELEKKCWLDDCEACPQLIKGYDSLAKSMQQAGSMLIKQAVVSSETILESLRKQRDALESFKELLERSDKLNLSVTETLLSSQMAKHKKGELQPCIAHDEPHHPTGTSPHPAARHAIAASVTGGVTLVKQRSIFVNYCLVSELSYIHKQQANVSAIYNHFVKNEIKHAKQWSEHWKSLEPYITEMPNAPQDFL
ncbi:hypothetical protein BDF20DRAFT_855665 [Mycotypha africana]|uniref:uncharacterized protein n=1 Tax=Mycotypha africana TaxID=64632 RepID=UPI0023015C9C|nr:uncharacterized protein BDF20DRAFT_855665 [Mycotypha africana]KAI8988434.1 hypothetical protein BDF20DRAFT_855665 [Mycotypha africana]